MSVTALSSGTDPVDFTPAIRTPEQFRDAHARVDALLHQLTTSDLAHADERLEEVNTLQEAIEASPFRMVDQEVVARGFDPTVISRVE